MGVSIHEMNRLLNPEENPIKPLNVYRMKKDMEEENATYIIHIAENADINTEGFPSTINTHFRLVDRSDGRLSILAWNEGILTVGL